MTALFLLVNTVNLNQSTLNSVFLPIVPIGIIAYSFMFLWDNLCRNSCRFSSQCACLWASFLPLSWNEFDQERFVIGVGQESSPPIYLVVYLEDSEFIMTLFWAFLPSLGVVERIVSLKFEDLVNTLVVCSFMQTNGHHTSSHFSNRFLVASYFLNHYYFVNNSRARQRNHICCCHILLAGSLASDDLLVRLCNPA